MNNKEFLDDLKKWVIAEIDYKILGLKVVQGSSYVPYAHKKSEECFEKLCKSYEGLTEQEDLEENIVDRHSLELKEVYYKDLISGKRNFVLTKLTNCHKKIGDEIKVNEISLNVSDLYLPTNRSCLVRITCMSFIEEGLDIDQQYAIYGTEMIDKELSE